MPDCMPADIIIGGLVSRSQWGRMVEAHWGLEGVDPEKQTDGGGMVDFDGHLNLHDPDAPWGKSEELQAVLQEEGIPYDRNANAAYEYDGEAASFRPGTDGELIAVGGQDGGGVLVEADVMVDYLIRGLTLEQALSEPDAPNGLRLVCLRRDTTAVRVRGRDGLTGPPCPRARRTHPWAPPPKETMNMGSICDMHNAHRAAAVLERDPEFLGDLRRFVGATILSLETTVNEPIGTIKAYLALRMPDGTETTMDGPTLREVTDCGVVGFSLEDDYGQDELRGLIEGAVSDPDNGLDDDDRRALREELEALPDYY